jgi:hypothetical protein
MDLATFMMVFIDPLLPRTCDKAFDLDALVHGRIKGYPITFRVTLHLHQGTLATSMEVA